MALSSLTRTEPSIGNEVATNEAGGKHHQLVTLADSTGAMSGITTNPAAVQLRSSSGTEIATSSNPAYTKGPDATNDGNSGSALVNNYTALSAAGTLYEVSAMVDATVTAQRWLFVYDAASVTGSPIRKEPIPSGGGGGQNIVFPYGRAMSAGITVAISTALTSYSAPGSSEGHFYVRWTP